MLKKMLFTFPILNLQIIFVEKEKFAKKFTKLQILQKCFNSILLNQGRKATIQIECEVDNSSEVKADIERVEIFASLRVTYTIFHNLSIENSTILPLQRCEKYQFHTLGLKIPSGQPRREIGYFHLAMQASKIKFLIEMLLK